jgi:hypothetical protein
MKYLITLWVLFCSLLLAGCAQKLPVQEAGYGMVAVPYHFINRTKFGFLYAYEWRSSDAEVFSVMIKRGTYSNDVAISDPLPADQYLVDTIVLHYVSDVQIESKRNKQVFEVKDPFVVDVHEGAITLIPFVYELEQYIQSESILFKENMHYFEGDEQSFYHDKLSKREGIEQWEIVTLK